MTDDQGESKEENHHTVSSPSPDNFTVLLLKTAASFLSGILKNDKYMPVPLSEFKHFYYHLGITYEHLEGSVN
jgi:hypothetical protein